MIEKRHTNKKMKELSYFLVDKIHKLVIIKLELIIVLSSVLMLKNPCRLQIQVLLTRLNHAYGLLSV